MNRSTIAVLIVLALGIWANALIPLLRPAVTKAASTLSCWGGLTPAPSGNGQALQFWCN